MSIVFRSANIHLLRLFFAPLDHLEKVHDRLSLIIVEVERRLIRDPTVDASSAGVHPEKVTISERFCQSASAGRPVSPMLSETSIKTTHLAKSGRAP